MKRYQLTLSEITQDDDGDTVWTSVVDVSGSAALCAAVLPMLAEEIGVMRAGPLPAVDQDANRYLPDAAFMQADADRAEAEQDAADSGPKFEDVAPGDLPKRRRRTKAEMEAARAAEAAGHGPDGSGAGPNDTPTSEAAPAAVPAAPQSEVPQVAPTQIVEPIAVAATPPATGIYNPFAPTS